MERPVDPRKLKKEYLELYHELTEIVYRHDPLGLAPFDVPKDEYEGEAALIITRMGWKAKTLEEMTEILKTIFEDQVAEPMASDVWDACRRRGIR